MIFAAPFRCSRRKAGSNQGCLTRPFTRIFVRLGMLINISHRNRLPLAGFAIDPVQVVISHSHLGKSDHREPVCGGLGFGENVGSSANLSLECIVSCQNAPQNGAT